MTTTTDRLCRDCGKRIVGLWPEGRCYWCHIKRRDLLGRERDEVSAAHDHDCKEIADAQPASPEDIR